MEKNLWKSYIFKSAKDVECRPKNYYYNFIEVTTILQSQYSFWKRHSEIFGKFPKKSKQIKCDLNRTAM